MTEDDNFFRKWVNSELDTLTEKRVNEYTVRYGKTVPEEQRPELASRIRREVMRRSSMGRELDIYEPLRWTGVSAMLTVLGGVGLKYTADKSFSRGALYMLIATTALNSVIQLVRLVPRFEAGLQGGLDVALAMQQLDSRERERADGADYGEWKNRVQASFKAQTAETGRS